MDRRLVSLIESLGDCDRRLTARAGQNPMPAKPATIISQVDAKDVIAAGQRHVGEHYNRRARRVPDRCDLQTLPTPSHVNVVENYSRRETLAGNIHRRGGPYRLVAHGSP